MKMKRMILVFGLILATAIFADAQFESEGKLNTWTTEKVQHNPETEDTTYSVCKIRVSKNKGFDRLVFEFDAGQPKYVIQYLPSDIYETEGGNHKIQIAGNVFMVVSIYSIGVDEPLPCKLKNYPKKKLDFPSLMQIRSGVWVYGIWDFLIGVSDKKPFRVTELRSPTRLVIDFKH
jgi:hypothetical protein